VFSLDEITKACADRECAKKIGLLDRIPFKLTLVLGEGELKKRDLSKTDTPVLETDVQVKTPEQAMVNKVMVAPNLTGISSWRMNPKVWSQTIQSPYMDVFTMGSATGPDTTLRLNKWTAFWGDTLVKRSLKKVHLSGDSF
jgi:hypothetical protein